MEIIGVLGLLALGYGIWGLERVSIQLYEIGQVVEEMNRRQRDTVEELSEFARSGASESEH
ncbi:MAG: hypothetical protein ACRD11_12485 [Terriglobia bacterium]